ncbi:hypothetical protein CP967_15815 [Streptomyces nitrosporeus]|uniref:Uncharacterized protein n=1 Tax=Streptomyces nitrosporeus TaxID=28894 RepID=A0A5J6FEE6_9ACTN|nr:hypothetical protein [Streptomyces nitrosporeus]QEU73280.1 hypothetical protein CP967_15815 [Streptomyces nitrosporeus]GGZ09271.1 hypothetical protein GCM10010327_44560 [Streptomyces nitrosporeus]
MNMQQAADRADGILDHLLAEIRPEVRWVHGPTTTGGCDVTRRRAVMTVVSAERRGNFLGLVERSWRASGYRFESVNNDPEAPAVFARTEDGFGVGLVVGGEGQVFFEVDSPCVEVSEVADPTSRATAALDAGAEGIPRPRVRSPFWSAGAP